MQPRHPFCGYDLTRPHIAILFKLSRSNTGMSVKELAAALNVTSGAVTQFADALIEKQLVERTEDPDDRRSKRLTLAEQTRREFERGRTRYLAHVSEQFGALTVAELQELVRLLRKAAVQ